MFGTIWLDLQYHTCSSLVLGKKDFVIFKVLRDLQNIFQPDYVRTYIAKYAATSVYNDFKSVLKEHLI